MTQRDSGSPSFDPKHRIIGAVVIVALAVILLPLILKEREPSPKPGQAGPMTGPMPWAATETPAGDNKVAVTVVTPPVRSNPPPKQPVPPPPMTAPAVSASVVGAATPSAPDPARSVPASAASPSKPAAPATPKTVTSGWVVQVGTFASTTNAARVQDKLRSMGQQVQAEPVSLQGSNAVRVRVGPFRDRTAALKAQDRIRKETGMKVVVLAYP